MISGARLPGVPSCVLRAVFLVCLEMLKSAILTQIGDGDVVMSFWGVVSLGCGKKYGGRGDGIGGNCGCGDG